MHRPTLMTLALGALALASAANAAQPASCDRTCMRGVLDQYLNALVKHDPTAAPLVTGYRHTENAINVPLGKGLWKSATALGKVQRRYFDPVSAQAAYYGTLEESGKPAVVTVRVKIDNRRVIEAEWYVNRDGDPGLPGANPPSMWNPTQLAHTPPPERNIPVAQRLPRAAMLAIVDSYFDGITSHDGTVVLAHDGCNRYENGTKVTGRRGGGAADDCKSSYAGFNLHNVAGRRVGFVDEEQGMVLGMAVFIRRPGSPVPRNAFSEWFQIEDGKIRDIWTAMYYPPPERPVPNWPPYEGNFPLPLGVMLPEPPRAAPPAPAPAQ